MCAARFTCEVPGKSANAAIANAIIDALPPERAAHYARFIADYEQIRSAECRGSDSDDFYLNLPHRDISGKNHQQWRIRARTYACLMEKVLRSLPRGARILDLGAGNCWLSFRLALAGFQPTAVDLLTNAYDGLGAAEHYSRVLPALFPRIRAELEHLPFPDGQFHAAIFNASFHYAENAESALREALRCVKHGGLVIVSDTPWYSSAASGDRMVAERRAHFLARYGTPSASLESIEYLTAERLHQLAQCASLRWKTYTPSYGLRFSLRPFLAKLRGRREPARFRIYVARRRA